jgi:replicative DNA helicase
VRIEQTILSNLIYDESYARRVLPFLKDDYFQDQTEKILFSEIDNFIDKYNGIPTKETLLIELNKKENIPEQIFKNLIEYVEQITFEKKDSTWLIDNTEQFCQERAVYNAIMESISIIEGRSQNKEKGGIPTILADALGVSFDDHIGHDFLLDAEERFEFYNKKEDRIPFDLDYFNTITKGGLPRKTLNVFIAGTGVGKTLAMCHMAAANMLNGQNVLYITLEMAEERIAERVDSNLLNIPVNELEGFPKKIYDDKINKLRKKTSGKLIVKEFPTATVGSNHFRHLLNELSLKKNFQPDIVYIDYINLCTSSRLKYGSNVNSYSYIKAVAEELRGLAVEKNIPIVSATQLNRTGFTNSDPGLEDTSESFALPATVDFMCALISTEEMEQLGQIMIKQLKNRYGDPTQNRRFVVGVDRAKMRLYNVEQSAQSDIVDDRPVMDKSEFAERFDEEENMKWMTKKAGRKDFSKLFAS